MRGGAGRSRWREAKQRLSVDPEVARARAQRLEQAIRPDFRRAVLAVVGALIALSVGGTLGGLYARSTQTKLIAVGLAAAFVVLAVCATRSAASEVARIVTVRAGTSAAATLRLIILLSGYLITVIAVLGLLQVPLGRLLLGGAITGIVIGIAAQQTLGHVFAGLVILLARPFIIGDDISVRSGALGGPFEGTVTSLGLLYTTLDTDTGLVHLPNAGLLASAVGPQPSPASRETVDADLSTSRPVDLTDSAPSTGAPTRPMNQSAG